MGISNKISQHNAERAIDALRKAHIDHGVVELSPESLVCDFLADLMHLHEEDWVQKRLLMAKIHFEEERDDGDD
tara:strand:+ start:303 stop:524 length:222 start_codon:yes stop_codon:yes gene_type:complete